MPDFMKGITSFRGDVFPQQAALYRQLAHEGQSPQALMISCADSRVMPEAITQSGPGELFVCRNAGNIVPPFSTMNGGVSSAIEYGVMALGVRDIIVCGHSECGAMKGLCCPHLLEPMPNVAAWLRHSHAAHSVVSQAYPQGLSEPDMIRAVALENVLVQLITCARILRSRRSWRRARSRCMAGSSTSRPAACWSMTARNANACCPATARTCRSRSGAASSRSLPRRPPSRRSDDHAEIRLLILA